MIRVAVCHDYTLMRKGAVQAIGQFTDCTVVGEAGDGASLINLVMGGTEVDVVILDICMPVMDGYVTASKLSQFFPSLRTIAYSMCSSTYSIIGMLSAGAKAFVTKDEKEEDIHLAIQDVHSKGYHINRYVPPRMASTIKNGHIENEFKLTAKELEMIPLFCSDTSYQQMASLLSISVKTIDNHRENICRKLKVKTRTGLATIACGWD